MGYQVRSVGGIEVIGWAGMLFGGFFCNGSGSCRGERPPLSLRGLLLKRSCCYPFAIWMRNQMETTPRQKLRMLSVYWVRVYRVTLSSSFNLEVQNGGNGGTPRSRDLGAMEHHVHGISSIMVRLTVPGAEQPDLAETFIAVVNWVAAVQPALVAVALWTMVPQNRRNNITMSSEQSSPSSFTPS